MFRYMDYIYSVYEERSFSRAAQKLHISQSSLSITVRRAEKKIGTQIFSRSTMPITLTDFGEKYIEAVKVIHTLQNDLDEYVLQLGSKIKGRVAIGASSFFSTHLLSNAILEFRRTYPDVRIELFDNVMPILEKRLDSSFIDLIISNTKKDEQYYDNILLFPDYLYLMISPELCPANISYKQRAEFKDIGKKVPTQGITLEKFGNVPFLLLHTGNNLRYCADMIMEEAKIHPPIVLEVDETMTLYPMTKSGMGAAIVGSYVISKLGAPSDALFFPLKSKIARRGTYINILKHKQITPALRLFVSYLKNAKH